ncbi:hypothetical protein, partial [uncultured Shimia sp.]|uniref:hypothetical protein n=1 Tax=uncultured Shimia sp. TaxID=573152 RepID=UPI0025D69ACA
MSQQAPTFKPVADDAELSAAEQTALRPTMAEIEAAWAEKNYVFVRDGLRRHVEETDQPLVQFRYGRVLLEALGGPRDLEGA